LSGQSASKKAKLDPNEKRDAGLVVGVSIWEDKKMSEHARWQGRYSVPDYIFGEEPNAFLAAQKHLLPKSGKALAVADGEARNGVWLAEQGLDVTSIDFSSNAQDKARALAKKRGVNLTLECVDVHAWPYPENTYDVVVEIFTQFSTPEERAVKWDSMIRALKPGGLLLLEGYTPKQLEYKTGGPKEVERLYTRAMLEKGFAKLARFEIKEYETHMSEGAGHAGMAAVIDLIGYK
jgi:SAM-dependent methyltransferase